MKKLTLIALAMTGAIQAQAAEVYKNDTMALDLYGRIYAGHFFGDKKELDTNGAIKNDYSAKQGANQFVRFGAKAESQIQSGLKALAQYEVQMYINDSEKTISENSDNLRTRLAFAGVGADWGTVTFGRQKGAMGFLADWTDVSLSDGYGNDALGAKTDTFATNRAGSVLKYSGLFNGLQFDASYKFDGGDTEETTSKESDAAYGAALAYTFPFNLSLGTAYNVGQRDKSGEKDAKLWLISAKYDNKAAYAALSYADGSDFLATGKDHTGWEAALGYNFENGFGLMALWNKQKVEQSGKADTDTVDYYTLGAQYKFNKNLRVIGEYRINNLDSTPGKATANQDDFQLAARYDF
ncbi:porin [Aeromonas schubertii]|uniref:Outer membrane porin n=1 Tax=Aeromonas schubertii TaxID=652 RepID=A0A0S2SER6_9GAMM|nr:porin [Aeromonas schubertii]ALP40180.1 outer membrane porin [Aeromonas schubertii]MBZ6072743.1 porin [Aeromonas schubertii]QCG49801.1 porin [Aeromonas schubertii]